MTSLSKTWKLSPQIQNISARFCFLCKKLKFLYCITLDTRSHNIPWNWAFLNPDIHQESLRFYTWRISFNGWRIVKLSFKSDIPFQNVKIASTNTKYICILIDSVFLVKTQVLVLYLSICVSQYCHHLKLRVFNSDIHQESFGFTLERFPFMMEDSPLKVISFFKTWKLCPQVQNISAYW